MVHGMGVSVVWGRVVMLWYVFVVSRWQWQVSAYGVMWVERIVNYHLLHRFGVIWCSGQVQFSCKGDGCHVWSHSLVALTRWD